MRLSGFDTQVERSDIPCNGATQPKDFSIDWLPDTAENRKVSVVFLRLLEDSNGKLFTLQQLAEIIGSNNRQAASQHVEDFRDSGQDFKGLVLFDHLRFKLPTLSLGILRDTLP